MQTSTESEREAPAGAAVGRGGVNPHRSSRRPEPTDASRRAEVRQHLDARTARLQAYVTSLEEALESRPSDEHAAQLERSLAQGRRELEASVRPRLPARAPLSKATTPES